MTRPPAKVTQTAAEDSGTATPNVAELAGLKSAWRPRGLLAALFPLRVILFLALFAWILHTWVDLRLVFQWRESLFLLNFHYLSKFLTRPGALMEWMDRLLVQSCYWGWPGVIAVTAAAWLLLVATIGLMNARGRPLVRGTWVVPAILLVAVCAIPVPGVHRRRSGAGRDRRQRLDQGSGPPPVTATDLVPHDIRSAVLRCRPGVLQLRGVLRDQ